MKIALFWEVELLGFIISRRYHLTFLIAGVISSTLQMETTRPSETSVYIKPTRCHILEGGILQDMNPCRDSN
jgi:hypothetical protein